MGAFNSEEGTDRISGKVSATAEIGKTRGKRRRVREEVAEENI